MLICSFLYLLCFFLEILFFPLYWNEFTYDRYTCILYVYVLQVCGVVGGPVSLGVVRRVLLAGWSRLRDRCIAGCSSSGSGGVDCDINNTGTYNGTVPHLGHGHNLFTLYITGSWVIYKKKFADKEVTYCATFISTYLLKVFLICWTIFPELLKFLNNKKLKNFVFYYVDHGFKNP